MSFPSRLALALAIVAVDLVAFALPLGSLFAAYVIVARPAVFLHWVLRLYGGDGASPAPR